MSFPMSWMELRDPETIREQEEAERQCQGSLGRTGVSGIHTAMCLSGSVGLWDPCSPCHPSPPMGQNKVKLTVPCVAQGQEMRNDILRQRILGRVTLDRSPPFSRSSLAPGTLSALTHVSHACHLSPFMLSFREHW